MFYKPSIKQPGETKLDIADILAHCGLKYIDHIIFFRKGASEHFHIWTK